MEINKNLIERWEQNQNRLPGRKRGYYIKLGIILGVSLVIILLIIMGVTDLVVRPDIDLSVKTNPGEWAMYGRDLDHSGVETLGNVMPQGEVSKVFTAGAGMHSSPVIAGGIIYAGSRDGKLYAIQESSGQLLWSYRTGSWVDSSATVVNNIVYFGSNDGSFTALNAKTGVKIWDYQVRYPVKSSAAVADGKVYFGCDDYSIYCLDANTGKKIWSKETGGSISSSPAVFEGILFVGSVDGNFYALNAANGKQRFRLNTRKIIVSSPVVSGDKAYFVSSDAVVYATEGKARNWFGEFVLRPPWQVLHFYGDLPAPPLPSGYLWSVFSWGDFTTASPTLHGDNLYIGFSKKVVSINLTARDRQWVTPINGTVAYAGILSQDTVYATASDGHLYLLNAASGKIIKDIAVGGPISTSPLMVDGKVYITSEDGNMYLVK